MYLVHHSPWKKKAFEHHLEQYDLKMIDHEFRDVIVPMKHHSRELELEEFSMNAILAKLDSGNRKRSFDSYQNCRALRNSAKAAASKLNMHVIDFLNIPR